MEPLHAPPAYARAAYCDEPTSTPRDSAHCRHVCAGTGAHPTQICAGTGAHPCHICAGTARTPATSALGLRSPLPHLRCLWDALCGRQDDLKALELFPFASASADYTRAPDAKAFGRAAGRLSEPDRSRLRVLGRRPPSARSQRSHMHAPCAVRARLRVHLCVLGALQLVLARAH